MLERRRLQTADWREMAALLARSLHDVHPPGRYGGCAVCDVLYKAKTSGLLEEK